MRAYLIAAAAMFALDQVSKWAVVERLGLKDRLVIDVAPPYLRFVMGWNEGVNFGLLSGAPEVLRYALIVLAIVICVWVTRFARADGRTGIMAAAGLLVGGALGNAVDRIAHGAVADFLNMSCCGIANPFAFNLADVGIFAGAITLVIFAGTHDTP